MSVIPYRGKDVNMISVGPSKAYDKTTLQDAVQLIRDSPPNGVPAFDNPYVIMLAPYLIQARNNDDAVEVTGALSYCSIVGEDPLNSVVVDTGTGNYPAITLGGSVASTASLKDFSLNNFRVVRYKEATLDTVLGAIRLGYSSGGGTVGSSDQVWDNISISNMTVEHPYMAFDLFGVNSAAASSGSPRLSLINNRFFGIRMSTRVRGNINCFSKGNIHKIQGTGPTTFLKEYISGYSIAGGGHSVILFDTDNTGGDVLDDCIWLSHNDALFSIADSNLGGASSLRNWIGYWIKEEGNTIRKMHFVNPLIDMEYSWATVHTCAKLGAFAIGQNTDSTISAGDFTISGGLINQRILAGADTLNDNLQGIKLNTAQPSEIQVAGTIINQEDGVGSHNLYSLETSQANNTISAKVYSASGVNVVAGAIAALTEQP